MIAETGIIEPDQTSRSYTITTTDGDRFTETAVYVIEDSDGALIMRHNWQTFATTSDGRRRMVANGSRDDRYVSPISGPIDHQVRREALDMLAELIEQSDDAAA